MTQETHDPDEDIWSAKVWRVRAADGTGEVGPVSLDQVRRGLDAGKLEAAAKVARNGSDHWLSARNIIEAAITRDKALAKKPPSDPDPLPPSFVSRVHVSDPDRTTPGARMPPGDRTSPAVAPLVLLGLFSVIGASWASHRYLGPRSSGVAPQSEISLDRLPRWTVAVTESRIREDLEDLPTVPPSYVAAWLAEHVCGGVNLDARLRQAQGATVAKTQELGLTELSGQETWLRAMRCGGELARSLPAPRRTTVLFEADGESHVVTSLMIDTDRMPEVSGWVPHTYGGLKGFCEPSGEGECRPSRPAGFQDGRAWFFGSHDAVEAFAASYTSAHRDRSSNVDILAGLAQHARGASTRIRIVRPSSVPWKDLCTRVAPQHGQEEFLKACFPSASRAGFASAETKSRGVLIERGHVAVDERIFWSLVVLARSEEAARWVEGDLLDVRRDWRSHLVDTEPVLIRRLRDGDPFWAGAAEPLARAFLEMRVERRGLGVRLEANAALTPDERKRLREVVDAPNPDHEAMVAVLDALVAGSLPPVEALSRFLGKEVALWATAPRANEKDCRLLQGKVEALSTDPSALDRLELRDRISRAFAPEACKGRVLTDDFRSCLMSAESLVNFAACEPPKAPYVAEARP